MPETNGTEITYDTYKTIHGKGFWFRGGRVTMKKFAKLYLDDYAFMPASIAGTEKETEYFADFWEVIDLFSDDMYKFFLRRIYWKWYPYFKAIDHRNSTDPWAPEPYPEPEPEPEVYVDPNAEVVFRANATTDFYANSALDSFVINFEVSDYYIFDNTSINIFLNFFFIILFFSLIYSSNFNLKNSLSVINLILKFLNFFFNIFKTLIFSIRLERFFIFILSIFFFVLFQNLGGFSLFEVSFTSHAIITLFLSFIIFFNYFINFLINFNEYSYKKFVQKKLNIALIIILFIIEFVSFFVRPFSLGVRLFANILSGHILMHIFFNAFLYAYKMFFWLSLFLLLFSIFILIMELFVACVQSYIFFMLSIIYLQDVPKLHG